MNFSNLLNGHIIQTLIETDSDEFGIARVIMGCLNNTRTLHKVSSNHRQGRIFILLRSFSGAIHIQASPSNNRIRGLHRIVLRKCNKTLLGSICTAHKVRKGLLKQSGRTQHLATTRKDHIPAILEEHEELLVGRPSHHENASILPLFSGNLSNLQNTRFHSSYLLSTRIIYKNICSKLHITVHGQSFVRIPLQRDRS